MEEKGISQYKMIELGIDRRVLDSLRKNKNITALTIEKLCKVLDCTPNDIIEFHD
jgi:DNA-binding Xre family transcriptional regulator